MKKDAVGLALTWDGARWPAGRLSPRARAFLASPLSAAKLSAALQDGKIGEIRICWVPRLKGGPAVLCDPFRAPDGRRLSFRLERTVPFGDVLGAVYKRKRQPDAVRRSF
jgi:hypothetical protein